MRQRAWSHFKGAKWPSRQSGRALWQAAGIEFIGNADGAIYTYDVNTNTNYNPDAEARAGRSGMDTLARYLGAELTRLSPAGRRNGEQPGSRSGMPA